MTQIEFYEDGGAWHMNLSGHAGFGEAGSDVVCAAASMLAYTLVECLQEQDGWGHMEELLVHQDEAEMRITARPEGEARDKFYWLLDTIATGFSLLSEHYPNFVSFSG